MKNTWIQTAESRNVNDRIENEDALLEQYYITDQKNNLHNRIMAIAQATIEEFWRPEAFQDSDEYCQHMMHWKEVVDRSVPRQTVNKFMGGYKEGSLFNFVMLAILDDIEFYNKFYSDLFYDRCKEFACGCPVCFNPKKAIAV